MAITIPLDVGDLVLQLAALDDQTFDKIAAGLERATPMLYPEEFVGRLKSELSDVDPGSVQVVADLALAASLLSRRGSGDTPDKKAREIVEGIPQKESFNIDAIQARVFRLLSNKTMSLIAKALEVLYESPRQLMQTRVLSDIRPIFGEDITRPDAGMVVHALKIEYSGDHTRHEFFVALDRRDITLLIDALNRALTKDDALSEVLKASGVQEIPIVGRDVS